MSDDFVELLGTVVKEREFPCGCSAALVGRNAIESKAGRWVSDLAPAFVPCAVHEVLVDDVRSMVAAGKPGDPFVILEAAMTKALARG